MHQESRDCWEKWQGVRCQLCRGPVRVITVVCRWPVPPDAAGATPSCRRSEAREWRRPPPVVPESFCCCCCYLLQILTSRRCSPASLSLSTAIPFYLSSSVRLFFEVRYINLHNACMCGRAWACACVYIYLPTRFVIYTCVSLFIVFYCGR